MRRLKTGVVVFALSFGAVTFIGACDCNKPKGPSGGVTEADQQNWPAALFYGRLDMPEKEMYRQATEGYALGYQLLGPNVVKHHYNQTGPTEHGAMGGTDVFWVKDQNVFFLHSECNGHHTDGYIGPFKGDPREVMKPVTPPDPNALSPRLVEDGGKT